MVTGISLYGNGLTVRVDGQTWPALVLVRQGIEETIPLEELALGDTIRHDGKCYLVQRSSEEVRLHTIGHGNPYQYAGHWWTLGGQTGYPLADAEHPFGRPHPTSGAVFPVFRELLVFALSFTEISD